MHQPIDGVEDLTPSRDVKLSEMFTEQLNKIQLARPPVTDAEHGWFKGARAIVHQIEALEQSGYLVDYDIVQGEQ